MIRTDDRSQASQRVLHPVVHGLDGDDKEISENSVALRILDNWIVYKYISWSEEVVC